MKEMQFTSYETMLLEEYSLSPDELSGIKVLEYEKSEFICIEGLPIYDLLFVIEGKAKVCFQAENGKRLLLCFYDRGGMIGDVELMMNGNTAKTSIQTISAVKCIGLPLVQNRKRLLSNTVFLLYIGTTLARKLDRCSRNSAHIILDTLEARLSSYIEITSREGVFQDKLTDVAELLGTSYRHLLRVLERLCKQGVLEKQTRGYGINNFAALRQNGQGFYDPVEKKYLANS